MSSSQKPPIPPYLNIDPRSAADKLSDPIDTTRFAKAATFAAKGREDLARRGHAPDGKKHLRSFSTWEVCRYLIPVAPAHFRRVLKANPDLPQGVGEGGSKWFTLEDILALRKHFDSEGAADREYLPYRPKNLPAKIISVANFKGGVGKTSTAAHLAMSAALDGYKVLVIDLDSQGSMTSIMGGQVQDDLIQPTHWPNIDLIGAQLNLYWAEFQVPVWRMQLRSWALWDALSNALASEDILTDYDIILLDTPPALGYLTINALAAADILLVPLGASFLEFDSTGRFFDMLYSTFASIEDGENTVRRRQGLPEMKFEWDAVRAIVTRFDASQQTDLANVIQAYFGDFMTTYRQEMTAMVGQAGENVNGIYEADYRDFNRDTYIRGRETFDRTWAEVKEVLLGTWCRRSGQT